MEDQLREIFRPLRQRAAAPRFPSNRPVLAHYTSLEVAESILKTNTIWFSNPMWMNDIQELQHGVNMGLELFRRAEASFGGLTEQAFAQLKKAMDAIYENFNRGNALDIYACACQSMMAHQMDCFRCGGATDRMAMASLSSWTVKGPRFCDEVQLSSRSSCQWAILCRESSSV